MLYEGYPKKTNPVEDQRYVKRAGASMHGPLELFGIPDGQLVAVPLRMLYRLHQSAMPVWLSTTTFSMADILEVASSKDHVIEKQSTTTVDVSTTGLNGVTISTSDLAGNVSVTNGNAGVTFSTSQDGVLQVGDVITTAGGNSRRLISGSGTSWTAESTWGATENAVTCKRGGRAKNTAYNLYAISDGLTPGLILSTRCVEIGDTLVDLPAGYTYSRQLPFGVALNSSAEIIKFFVKGWPYGVEVYFDVFLDFSGTRPTLLKSAGADTNYTDIDFSALMPSCSTIAIVYAASNISTSTETFFQTNGSSSGGQAALRGNGYHMSGGLVYETDANRILEYKVAGGSASVDVMAQGFVVNKVA